MRKTALLLAALLVVCTACGETATGVDTTAPALESTEPSETTIAPDDPLLPHKTFGGQTINFLVIDQSHNANNYSQEIYAEEENGDALNDAVYRRNELLKEKYNIKIDPNTITENTNLQEDLGADSLDLVEIIMEFETKFGLEIPDEDILKFKTIGDAVKYIEAHK